CAAGHLQEPPAPVWPGVRLYHACGIDQRAAWPRVSADDEPAARLVRTHHPDPHDHRPARVRDRPPAVLVPARPVSLSERRGLMPADPVNLVDFRNVTKRFGALTV